MTAIFAQFDTGKAQVCGTEMVVADQAMIVDKKMRCQGGFRPVWLILALWVLLSHVLAMRVVMSKVRDAISAMRSDANTPAESSNARGVPIDRNPGGGL